MSIAARLIRLAVKLTPNALIAVVANVVLKGVAQVLAFNFDLDTRRLYIRTLLCGEEKPITLCLNDFVILQENGSYRFILNQAESDRLWLNNLLARLVGKAIKIPVPPQFMPQFALLAEVFAPIQPAQPSHE